MITRFLSAVVLAGVLALAAHAVADLPSVIALDGAAGSPPRVVLVLATGPADTLAVTAWLSAVDTTAVAVNAAKLQRTPTGVKGEITFEKSGIKPISCSYRLEGTVADGVLTGSYTGMEGDVTVTGTLRWGTDALPLGHALFTPSPAHPVGWMGDLSGRYSGARDFPLEWDTTTGKNILWKSQLPIGGHSSPIVVGRKVFLTCEPDLTVCLDADTGAILWQHAGDGLRKGSSGIYHHSTGYSMGTICSDGANLFVTHYNGVVMSYDLNGNVRWRKDVPALGWSGASPCMLDGKFIVIQGNGTHERRGPYDLVAYSCTDGAVVWNTSAVIKQSGWHYNGITPMWVAGTPYVVNFTGQFFNARNGRLVAKLFSDAGPQWVPAVEGNTVVLTRQLMRTDKWREGMLDLAKVDLPEPMGMAEALQRDKTLLVGKVPRGLASGSHSQHDALVVALTAASDGKDSLLFTPRQKPILILDRAGATTASLLAGDIFYHVGESGMNVLDLATGASLNPGGYDGMEIKPSRPAPRGLFGGSGLLYSAPVLTGEYLTVSDWGGRTHVFNRAPELRELSVNLTEYLQKPPAGNPISGPAGGLASSEFYSGNRIYFRHWDALYCIGDPQATEHAAAFADAKALATAGKTKEALQAYHALWNAEPLHIRYRAIREMGDVLGVKAMDEFGLTFRHPDTNLRALAVSVATKIPGDEMTHALATGLTDADPAYRCIILGALGQRADRAAATRVAGVLDDLDASVRMAALAAAGRIGGTDLAQAVVAHLERFSDAERQAATRALTAMPEPGTISALIALVPQATPVPRSVLVRVLGERGCVDQVALVLADIGHANRAVRLASLDALGRIGGIANLDVIVARIARAEDDEERQAVAGALSSIQQRTKATDIFAAAVLRGLPTVTGTGTAALIRILGPAGGAESLRAVQLAVKSTEPVLHGAAIAALAAWPDTAPAADLMALAGNEQNAVNQATIARGLLRMIDLTPQRPADGVFALYKCALKTGQELATTVVHMENWKDVRGIVLIGGLLDKHHDIEPTIANVMCNIAHGAAVKDAKGAIGALEGAATHLTIKSAREGVGNTIAILRRNYKINDYIAPPGVPDAPDAP